MAENIGDVLIKSPVVACPMAGVTDRAYREILSDMGAGLTVTEMVSAKAVVYGNKNTLSLTERGKETVSAIQLFGNDPDIMAEAAKRFENTFDIIDINMGCPVPKIVGNHEGSYLLKDIYLSEKIIKKLSDSVRIPVTVKIRKGFDMDEETAPEFAKMAENAGARAITVHGRTRCQMYSGKADWETVKRVREAVKIPVIGNGDIKSPHDAKRMMEETGVRLVGIGRALEGNPWLIRKTLEYLKTGQNSSDVSLTERREMIKRHILLSMSYKGEKLTVLEMRKHLSWYTEGLPGSCELRRKLNICQSLSELENLIDGYFGKG